MRVIKKEGFRTAPLFHCGLDEIIGVDNETRLVDAFVNSLDIEAMGFRIKEKQKTDAGPPEYNPSDLLKIYIYGYLNRVRSSRQLERCCQINIEMMWLISGVSPGHVTIANFRKNNAKSLKEVFKSYNRFLGEQDLFGKETIAIDGAKIRAQNSKKNNFSDKTIARHQKYIDKKIKKYQELLKESNDVKGESISKEELNEKLENLAKRKIHYDELQDQLNKVKEEGEKQISIIDADARLFTAIGLKGEVAYNLQSAVDEKHKLIVHNEITNKVDTNALYQIAFQSKRLLEVDEIKVLADTGYDTGEELQKCTEDNIITFVAPRLQKGGLKNANFSKSNFEYDKQTDSYTCPAGEILRTNNKIYTNKQKGRKTTFFKEYKLKFTTCNACIYKQDCANKRLNRKQSRVIERNSTADYTEANQQRVNENKDYYRLRQSIVEHPFGTIKRQWGYSYTLLKGLEKVGGEFDLICLCYNMRRSISIIGVNGLIERLKTTFLRIFHFSNFTNHVVPDIFKRVKRYPYIAF